MDHGLGPKSSFTRVRTFCGWLRLRRSKLLRDISCRGVDLLVESRVRRAGVDHTMHLQARSGGAAFWLKPIPMSLGQDRGRRGRMDHGLGPKSSFARVRTFCGRLRLRRSELLRQISRRGVDLLVESRVRRVAVDHPMQL